MPYTVEPEQLTTADLANAGGIAKVPPGEQNAEPLLPREVSVDMHTRWETIQTEFVDDPRASVQRADELVAAAIKKLAESFAEERAKLEQQWSKGNDVSTEDLRQALRRYRSFFQRLLSV
jgi:hypothetical protein